PRKGKRNVPHVCDQDGVTVSPSRPQAAREQEPPAGGTLRRWRGAFWAVVRQRCPRCPKGQMFRGQFTMDDPCPGGALLFPREGGYFLGARYASSLLGTAILVPFYFVLGWLLPGCNGALLALLALVPYLPLTPAVFRCSRVLWVHFERWACPSDVSAGAYE